MTDSANLEIELLEEGMDQAEIAVNEAIARLDAMAQIAIQDQDVTDPTSLTPSNGQCWIVASGSTGSWADQDGKIAVYYDGWTFVRPKSGWILFIIDERIYRRIREVTYSATLSFVDSNPDTITDGSNGFLTAGIVSGMFLTVTGTVSNNKQLKVNTAAAGTLTLVAGDALTAESSVACTLTAYDLIPLHSSEIAILSATTVWTNMPNAETELFGVSTTRRRFDLRPYGEFRLQGRLAVNGAAGSVIRAKYSTDSGSSWQALELGGGSGGEFALDGSTGVFAGAWTPIAVLGRADVWLNLFGQGGNAVADPSFNSLFIQVR